MYLTVQRVRSPHGALGINGALYRHREGDLPTGFWNASGYRVRGGPADRRAPGAGARGDRAGRQLGA